ncbi:MAG: glycosyltransferase family 4 protein [Streptosporangiaceae bacterium]
MVVSRGLASRYARRFGRDAIYVPNGVDAPQARPADTIKARYGLARRSYPLFVGRFVPEKAPDLLIRAYRRVPGERRLVIAGDSSFTDDCVAELRRLASEDPRMLFVGNVYGELLAELYSNAAAFVLPSYVEGMPLTLLEAASYGLPVVTSDIDPHREVCLDDGPGHRLFRSGDEVSLVRALRDALGGAADLDGAAGLRAQVLAEYRWDTAALLLEELYVRLVRGAAAASDTSRDVLAGATAGGVTPRSLPLEGSPSHPPG